MKRDFSIDFLRFIGIIGIMLSHSASPSLIMNMRSFDVPLMVFVSAICMANYSQISSYFKYIKSRIVRLWLPAAIFVLGYYFILPNSFPFEAKDAPSKLIAALTLYTPIYLWILRVFLLMALLSPLFVKIISRVKERANIAIILSLICINEILSRYAGDYGGEGYFRCVCLMTLGYAIITYTGITLAKSSNRKIFKVGSIVLSVFIVLVVLFYFAKSHFVSLQTMKYPPRLYYISYGLACSTILYALRNKITKYIKPTMVRNIISFIGSHTMWIYLWHIPIITHFANSYTWYIRFCIIIVIPSIITLIQTKVIQDIDKRYHIPLLSKVFIG